MLIQKRKTEFPVWGDVFGNIFNNDWAGLPLNYKENFGNFPAVNISESETEFKIEMAVPGKSREDFKIDIQENVLSISSEKTESSQKTEDNFTRREYNYQSFRRSFRLPEICETEKAEASYTDGILKIVLPKKVEQKDKIKTIAIK